MDDAVRERHGVACRDRANLTANVTVWEEGDTIYLSRDGSDRYLTQWQARYLASKLYRLARRIRARTEEQA